MKHVIYANQGTVALAIKGSMLSKAETDIQIFRTPIQIHYTDPANYFKQL